MHVRGKTDTRSTLKDHTGATDSTPNASPRLVARGSNSTIQTSGSGIGRTFTSNTIGGDSAEEDAEDIAIMHRLLKMREQALADVREAGSLNGVFVAGVQLGTLRGPVEMSSRDLTRFRGWADLCPPFDPIPSLEPVGDMGRPPKEAWLKMNQELLDNHAKEGNKALGGSLRQRPLNTGTGSAHQPDPMSSGFRSPSNLVTPASDSNFGRASGQPGSAMHDDGSPSRVRASSARNAPGSPG